jgi:hypothetical protein
MSASVLGSGPSVRQPEAKAAQESVAKKPPEQISTGEFLCDLVEVLTELSESLMRAAAYFSRSAREVLRVQRLDEESRQANPETVSPAEAVVELPQSGEVEAVVVVPSEPAPAEPPIAAESTVTVAAPPAADPQTVTASSPQAVVAATLATEPIVSAVASAPGESASITVASDPTDDMVIGSASAEESEEDVDEDDWDDEDDDEDDL